MKPSIPHLIYSLMAFSLALVFSCSSLHAADSASRFFKNPQKGDPGLKSIGRIAFGPDGLLLVSDPRSVSILAINTGDVGPVVKLEKKIEKIDSLLANALGVNTDTIVIVDMAVNPASGRIYFSLNTNPGKVPVLVAVDGKGKVSRPPLSEMEYVRITLPIGENAKLSNITDLAWADSSVLVIGRSNEKFPTKIYQLPLPLENGVNGRYFSAETYHVSHRKWEAGAPIQTFIPYEEDGELYVVGAFACTPIAKFPLSEIESKEKIKGVSVVELGGGNRPSDMFTYKKGGREWLVTSTKRFHKQFGPSLYWSARVDMQHIGANNAGKTNENAVRRNVKETSGPDAKGIEVVDVLYGAVQISQFENEHVIVLRETEKENSYDLEPLSLP